MGLHGLNTDPEVTGIHNLPAPDPDAQDHSRYLLEMIRAEIEKNNGRITFRDYMHMALYEPGLGYYSAGSRKFGKSGDFITAPELSSLFSQCLARQCSQVLQQLGSGDILEFGAGTGRMACDLMLELQRLESLPEHYLILESSADLRDRQYTYLREQLPYHIGRFEWLDSIPSEPVRGLVLANEVIDAMPVHRVVIRDTGIVEACVSWRDDGLTWSEAAAAPELLEYIQAIRQDAGTAWPDEYVTEVNLSLLPWVNTVASSLAEGLLLVIDYGYTRKEYYHPERTGGTLLCHFRHRAHPDPFFYPGLQDITASVDFTALAEAGAGSGLQVMGFTNQANFLLGCGLDEILALDDTDNRQYQQLAGQAKQLTLPDEMGERFLALAMGRGLPGPLLGFRQADQRYRL